MNHFKLVSLVSFFSACLACSGGSDGSQVPANADDSGSTSTEDTGSPTVQNDTGSPSIDDTGVVSSDTGTASETAVETPFSPKDLVGLVLWLDAAKGVDMSGVDVSAWHDQSGKSNDVAQADATKRPKTASLGGLPAIGFTPGLFLTRAADLSTDFNIGKGDATLAIVARDAGTDKASVGIVFQKCNQAVYPYAGLLAFLNLDGAQKWAGGSTGTNELLKTSGSLQTDKAHTLIYQRNGVQSALRIDGAEVNKMTLASVVDATSDDPLFVGNRADGKHPASSYVFEIVVVKGSVDAERTAKLESYLLGKYAK